MLADGGAWGVRHELPFETALAFLRRKVFLLAALSVAVILYLLIALIPEEHHYQFGFKFVHDSYDWSAQTPFYPISSYTPIPTGQPLSLPTVQYAFTTDNSAAGVVRQAVLTTRRDAVKAAFVKSWNSYKQAGFRYDDLLPVTGGGTDEAGLGGWGVTLTDSLDTLWIMGLTDDFYEAAAAAVTIDYSKTNQTSINYFETVIRHLAGLLGAFDLSQQSALLEKAIELGDMLYFDYDTPNHMPPFYYNFGFAKSGKQVADTSVGSAAVASSSLEFSRLTQLTGDNKYYDAINRVTHVFNTSQNQTLLPGMWPEYVNMAYEEFTSNTFTVGANSDSIYEYLGKTFALLGGLEPLYETMYRNAMDTINSSVLFRPQLPDQADILFPGSVYVSSSGVSLTAESQHLSCFIGGMFALGGKLFGIDEHVTLAEKLAQGCVWAYNAFPAGIMPEIFDMLSCDSLDPCAWNEEVWGVEGNSSLPKGFTSIPNEEYLLRPEAIESVFYMYRITGNAEWQDIAWSMFQAIQKSTETSLAFSSIQSVLTNDTVKTNSMESFWLAETLKYLYLIFSPPDLISLDEFVLNTEAHPFRRPLPSSANTIPITHTQGT
ncbi:glycoside hydrolase family 47 protein [Xylariaceae sp. FL0255]|nr:glycoside hydrolase family 47 protein [Xylariaceae sp. FL0255]